MITRCINGGLAGLFALLLLVGGLTMPVEALAQLGGCPINNTTCDQGAAYAGCMAHGTSYLGQNADFAKVQCKLVPGSGAQSSYECAVSVKSNPSGFNYACPSPRNWYFMTAQNCAGRVDGQAGMINGTLYSGGVCDNGCKVQPNLDRGTDFSLRENGNPNAISIRSGTWKATGDVCSITDTQPKPEKKDEYCHQTGNYTVCKSKDRTCITSASGFRTCASDTANEKGHTATNNPRTEAASISAPNTPPNPPTNRPGEDWKPSGPSTSVTNNNTGSTTNTQNFNNQGTPNGNQPTPGDGSGPGAGGSNGNGDGGGKEEGPPDSASDSGNCASPPQCTGDTLKCLQLNYTWRVQCNTKGAEITGGDGCTDKDIPICAGTTCKAEAYAQLLQQWRQGCAAKAAAEGMASRAGSISNPDDESALEGLWIKPGDSEGGGMKLRQDLISVGGGGSLLPNISLEGQSWQPPPEFFDSLAAIRLLVIAAATVTAMFIVGRNI